MVLRAYGLEDDALNYNLKDNFNDEDIDEYFNLLAYAKAHKELGFIGDIDGKFNSNETMNSKSFIKIMLNFLGYEYGKDYNWNNLLDFAREKNMNMVDKEKLNKLEAYYIFLNVLSLETKDGLKLSDKLIGNLNGYRGDKFNRSIYNTEGVKNFEDVLKYSLDGYKTYTQPTIDSNKNIYFGAYTIDLETGLGSSKLICLNPDMSEKRVKDFNTYLFTSPTLNEDEDIVYMGLPSKTGKDMVSLWL